MGGPPLRLRRYETQSKDRDASTFLRNRISGVVVEAKADLGDEAALELGSLQQPTHIISV